MANCPLCADLHSNESVTALLAGRIKASEVAKRYNTTAKVVTKHTEEHIQMALRPALRRIMQDPDTTKALAMARSQAAIVLVSKLGTLSDRIDDMESRLDKVVAQMERKARQEGNDEPDLAILTLLASMQKEMAKTYDTLQKYLRELGVWTGDVHEGTQVNFVQITQDYTKFKETILAVLSKHPAALQDLEDSMMGEVIDVKGVEKEGKVT